MEGKTSVARGCPVLGPFMQTRSGIWGATLSSGLTRSRESRRASEGASRGVVRAERPPEHPAEQPVAGEARSPVLSVRVGSWTQGGPVQGLQLVVV